MRKLLLFSALSFIVFSAGAQNERQLPQKQFPSLMRLTQKVNLSQAQNLLRSNLQLSSAESYRLADTQVDELGFTHQKYQQYFKSVKVEGGEYIIHARSGMIESMSGHYGNVAADFDVNAAVSSGAALDAAMRHVGAKTYAWEARVNKGFEGYTKPAGELVIISDPSVRDRQVLAYKLDVYAAEPVYRAWVYIDAKSGAYITEESRIHETNTSATASTLYNGSRSITADYTGSGYRLRQTVSGGGVETYSLNNGTNYNSATDITSGSSNFTGDQTANQAHWGAERTYDYYMSTHGRNSYNNSGGVIRSYVHYSNNYVNAYWDGSRMTYGDGDGSSYGPLVSLDICGHEITHGVTEYSANLVYQKESGALNESFSDIFGECIENYARGNNDWLMGDDIGIGGSGALRSMSNPNQFGDPDTYGGTNWINPNCSPSQFNDYCGVHTNSGVQNKWFYILAAGESGTNDIGSSYSVTGLGLTKAARIAYRNLTVYLTSSSTYAAARAGAIQSAIDLYGADSPEVIATTNAWYAVGVGSAYCSGCISYCTSAGGNSSYEWIASVKVGSFTNTSGAAGYTDFTSKTVSVSAGSSYSVTLTPGFSGSTYNEYWKIWIDFNKDGDFDDAGEQVYSAGPSSSAVTGSISIPSGASGTTRMRVSMKYNATSTACESFTYGEVEDYSISIGGGTPDTQAPTAPALSAGTVTSSSIAISWTASTDNVGVTGYDVYLNGSLNSSTTSTSATISGLSASTTYSIYVKAKDAAGNSTNSNTISVTTSAAGGGGGSGTVLASYFETGWDGWNDGGSDCGRTSSSRSYEGNYSIYIRDNSGTASAMTSSAYNVSQYNQLTIDFYFYSYSMENGEDFWVRYYNGSSWSTVAAYVAGSSYSGDGFYHATITLSNVNFPSNAQFRFQCDASSNSDIIYIDQVTITGASVAGLRGNGNDPVITQQLEQIGSAAIMGIDPIAVPELQVMPNPTSDYLRIVSSESLRAVRIYNANGTLVSQATSLQRGPNANNSVDVSRLRAGLYVVAIETESGEIRSKRFIKN